MEREGGSAWFEIASGQDELRGDAEGARQVADRFSGKYLPALRRAATPEERERVWLSFWHYLTARPTMRKPVTLSHGAADTLIAELQAAVSRLC